MGRTRRNGPVPPAPALEREVIDEENANASLARATPMIHDVTSIRSDAAQLAKVQHAARYGRVLLTRHAQEEAEDANVQARDIEHAIRTATRALVQGGKVRLEGGTDLDGHGLIVVVCEVQSGLRVITVF